MVPAPTSLDRDLLRRYFNSTTLHTFNSYGTFHGRPRWDILLSNPSRLSFRYRIFSGRKKKSDTSRLLSGSGVRMSSLLPLVGGR